MDLKVPSVDLAQPSDMEMVGGDTDYHSSILSDPAGANGEEAVAQMHTDTVMTHPQEQLSVDDHSMFSIGDLPVDQLPSSVDGDPATEPKEENSGGHNDQDADTGHFAQSSHDQAVDSTGTSPLDMDVHEQHGPLHVTSGDDDSPGSTHDNVSDHHDNGRYDHNISGSDTIAVADEGNQHTGQTHDPDMASVGHVPEVVLPDEAHDGSSSVENGTGPTHEFASLHDTTAGMEGGHESGQLEQFDVSHGSDPGSDGSLDHFSVSAGHEDAGANDDLHHFAVSDAGPAMEEVPPMDGLDATPDQQSLPEPEPADAGIGDHDAVISEDIHHDEDHLHHEVIPA